MSHRGDAEEGNNACMGILLMSCIEMWPAFAASRIWVTYGCPCRCLGVYMCGIMANVRNTFMSANYRTDSREWGHVRLARVECTMIRKHVH